MNILTLSDVIKHDNFTFALCTFIDEFKRSDYKQEMIENPPDEENAIKEHLCILVATAHKLANDYDLEAPEWVEEDIYKMPQPIFAFNTENKEYQDFLIQDTPYEFASKNIFHGANAVSRV